MDFNLSDLQRMLLDSAERFAADTYSLERARALRYSDDGLDRTIWAQFAELGWLALAIPEAQGGLGGSLADVAVLMTALGARCATEPLVSTAVIGVHLLAGSTRPDKDDILAAIGSGDTRIALAHDEPGDRFDYIGKRRTRVVRDGNGWSLSGDKMLAADAPSADRLIVTAQLEDEPGLALMLVETGADGVASEPYPLIDGSRAADLRFDGVSLPADALLVPPSQGRALLGAGVDRATVALMAQGVGSMEACLGICAAYLKERQQFGQPIGKFQALQHIMADMFVATHQARSALYQALAGFDGDDRERAVSLAKLVVGEAAQLVSRQAIQLHGGYGMTDEYAVSHHYRRLMVIEKLYGDLDHHARRLAD